MKIDKIIAKLRFLKKISFLEQGVAEFREGIQSARGRTGERDGNHLPYNTKEEKDSIRSIVNRE